jgi:DUF4097 and DUF4098 domain-containing protein YvlB
VPTYDTPSPITATIELIVGSVRIVAGDRADTVVDVRPTDPTRPGDLKAAEDTRVEYAAGTLTVVQPKTWRHYGPFNSVAGTVDVTVELPAGSKVNAETSIGSVHAEGRLGDTRIKAAMGDLHVVEAADLTLRSSHGDVTAGRVTGDADVSTGSGRLRIGEVAGHATVRNGNGDIRVGDVGGELRVKASNGEVTIDRAGRSVLVKGANGAIRVGEVVRGTANLRTAAGEIEVGVRRGTAAWLDVHSQHGNVRNGLDTADGPGDAAETVEVRARTSVGDITVRRSDGPVTLDTDFGGAA